MQRLKPRPALASPYAHKSVVVKTPNGVEIDRIRVLAPIFDLPRLYREAFDAAHRKYPSAFLFCDVSEGTPCEADGSPIKLNGKFLRIV